MKKITLLFFGILATFSATYGQISNVTFSQSNGVYAPLTGATILATQTVANGTSDAALDDVNYTVSLPFAFSFNGTNYPLASSIYVSTNGFVSFGATAPPVATYEPIGSTNVYDGAISAFGLDTNGGYGALGSCTSGSADITITAGTTTEFVIGAPVAGTGIPTGSTVVSTTATTVTISAACTSTGTGRTISVGTGEISYKVLGTTPNQQLVVQYKRMRPYNTSLRTIDFQIVLNETSNVINYVYGFSLGSNLAISAPQIGLRGATNAVFINRTGTGSWDTTTAGATNTNTVTFSSTALPSSGLTYTWEEVALTNDLPDYVNLQFPATATIPVGGSVTVYGRVYEAGLTDTTSGQAPGINSWVGISPVGSNTNPNTWTTWIPATFLGEVDNGFGNPTANDEYQILN